MRPGRKAETVVNTKQGEQLRQLATLIDAGIPVLDAWERLQQETGGNPRDARKHREQGTPLHDLMLRHGLLSPAQAQQLAVAAFSGQLSVCLRELAAAAEERHFSWMRLRSRLWLAYGLLGMGLLAGLVTTWVNPETGVDVFVVRAVSGIVPVILLVSITHRLMLRDSLWWSSCYWRAPSLLKLPVLKDTFEVTWYRLLQAQLSAGRDAASALEALKPLIDDRDFRGRLRGAADAVRGGASLTTALTRAGLVTSAYLQSALHSGEASGQVTRMIDSVLAATERRLRGNRDTIEQWWPRLLYVLSVIAAARMVLGG